MNVNAKSEFFQIYIENISLEVYNVTTMKGGLKMSEYETKIVFSKNLRKILDDRGISQAALASAVGSAESTVSSWCTGEKMPRMNKIERMAKYFNVKKSDLLEETSTLPGDILHIDQSRLHRIPILGRIAAGEPIYAEQNIEGYTYTEMNNGAEYFALRVSGDSMNAARIYDNDIVIVRRQDIVEDGQIAVVLIDGQDATLKRFSRHGDIVTLMPQSTNPANQPFIYDLKDTSVKVLGLVVKVEFRPA